MKIDWGYHLQGPRFPGEVLDQPRTQPIIRELQLPSLSHMRFSRDLCDLCSLLLNALEQALAGSNDSNSHSPLELEMKSHVPWSCTYYVIDPSTGLRKWSLEDDSDISDVRDLAGFQLTITDPWMELKLFPLLLEDYIYNDIRIHLSLLGTEAPSWRQHTSIRMLAETVSPDVLRLWWNTCQRTHGPLCKSPRIDDICGPLGRDFTLRLLAVRDRQVVIAPRDCSYIALSYVWGDVKVFRAQEKDFMPQVADLSCTGPDQSSIQMSSFILDLGDVKLPQTIEDAIKVTRDLGEEYLWVDSLCIVQDNMEELQRTLKRMDKIYRAAKLTIVALDNADADAGLSRVRPALIKHPIAEIGCTTLVLPRPSLMDCLPLGKWISRAWTFQEYLLSTKCLFFDRSQVHYKCTWEEWSEDRIERPESQERLLNEKLKTSKTPGIRFRKEAPQPNTHPNGNAILKTAGLDSYVSIVEKYSLRKIGSQFDVLNAFRGIMNDLELKLGTAFVFGLPTRWFDSALLWRPSSRQVDNPRLSMKRPAKLKRRSSYPHKAVMHDIPYFPSWSWLGWIGPVQYSNLEEINMVTAFPRARAPEIKAIKPSIEWPWAPWSCQYKFVPNEAQTDYAIVPTKHIPQGSESKTPRTDSQFPWHSFEVSSLERKIVPDTFPEHFKELAVLEFETEVAMLETVRLRQYGEEGWKCTEVRAGFPGSRSQSNWILDNGEQLTEEHVECILICEVETRFQRLDYVGDGSWSDLAWRYKDKQPLAALHIMLIERDEEDYALRRAIAAVDVQLWRSSHPKRSLIRLR